MLSSTAISPIKSLENTACSLLSSSSPSVQAYKPVLRILLCSLLVELWEVSESACLVWSFLFTKPRLDHLSFMVPSSHSNNSQSPPGLTFPFDSTTEYTLLAAPTASYKSPKQLYALRRNLRLDRCPRPHLSRPEDHLIASAPRTPTHPHMDPLLRDVFPPLPTPLAHDEAPRRRMRRLALQTPPSRTRRSPSLPSISKSKPPFSSTKRQKPSITATTNSVPGAHSSPRTCSSVSALAAGS